MHPRNRHQSRYDLNQLKAASPELAKHIIVNAYGDESIDFGDPESVKRLNQAILKKDYGLVYWDIPENYLCPPIPGRADYIHVLADLNPKAKVILDVGVGANCVYPIIGVSEYGWNFIGSEVDRVAASSAQIIVESNPSLKDKVEIRHQAIRENILKGVLKANEKIDFTMCNPPFHASAEEAQAGSQKKNRNLRIKDQLNFGGTHSELWCKGGEEAFVTKMIIESTTIATQCLWFTSLVSNKENLRGFERILKKVNVTDFKTIEMSQGQKTSRVLAWTFQ